MGLLQFLPILLGLVSLVGCSTSGPTTVSVRTTSGLLQGVDKDGIKSFKGVRFAQPPTGQLRWEPPVPLISIKAQNATMLGPSCVQQFAFDGAAFTEFLFNNPPPPESEDCLFLNVWTPSLSGKKPVIVWIYGGSFAFGTGSLPAYDGTSFATNQDLVVVTFNYRTNVFGFPTSPDLSIKGNNLGFMDQELVFKWVQANIAAFGGDPDKVTIMGQSAGIMLSGATTSRSPVPNFDPFNAFATAVNCTQAPGPARLQCLKKVPAQAIRNFTNGPTSGTFGTNFVVDNVTVFADPLQAIRTKQTPLLPILIGSMQDDGTLFTLGETDLPAFLNSTFGGAAATVPADFVRSLYPGLNDSSIIAEIFKDVVFMCPAELWAGALTQSGVSSVYRYTYGATFPDLQVAPGLGVFHSSELLGLWGNFNRTTATTGEATLSNSFQTAFANFVKNPNVLPAPNWPKYVPGNTTTTLARIAYNGNFATSNFVQAAISNSIDGPCDALWNKFIDFRP